MITLNHESRSQTEPLTLEEEREVIKLINVHLFEDGLYPNDEEIDLVQRFVNHYENLCHYKSYTEGLWATEEPEKVIDKENVLFQIKF